MDQSETTSRPPPPGTWKPAQRAMDALASPIQQILAIEAASGLILMAATVVALVWANVATGSYEDLWHVPFGFQLGDWSFFRSLHFWINDGLMTVFFLVVGLEIRREIYEGELATLKQAALPLVAALGGMLAPAIIFAILNAGRAGAAGWAIPMATDIAFAVGVLTLLGSRVPASWRMLLLALAVIDDIGAIIVIAAFYSGGIALEGLALTVAGLAAVLILRAAGIRSVVAYLGPGVLVWAGLYLAGIHPTLAGVLLGLLTPVRPWYGPSGFAETAQAHLDSAHVDRNALLLSLDEIERARREAVSPVERLIHVLHPWVAYVIMPLFALANAGVVIGGANITSGDSWWLFLGVVAGLAVGKPIGIAALTLGSSKLGFASRSAEMTKHGVLLVGMVGGIGFTMSLFIAQLAFPPGPLLDTAKLAILVGSGVAMIVGLAVGLTTLRKR